MGLTLVVFDSCDRVQDINSMFTEYQQEIINGLICVVYMGTNHPSDLVRLNETETIRYFPEYNQESDKFLRSRKVSKIHVFANADFVEVPRKPKTRVTDEVIESQDKKLRHISWEGLAKTLEKYRKSCNKPNVVFTEAEGEEES
ncbi:hypothetical protein GEMRC1_000399 [Eukaryota sp. GEM-RC1]